MRYPIVLHTDDGTSYGVTVPDVPGCFSAGETLDDALDMAVEAITGHIEILVEDSEDAPLPQSLAAHKDNPDFADGVWAFVDIDLTQFSWKTSKINATLPDRLIHKIDAQVDKGKYKSRSAFLAEVAMQELEKHEAA